MQGPLSVNLPELPIRNSPEFEVGNGKNYLHPQPVVVFSSRSVKILVGIVGCPLEQEENLFPELHFDLFHELP